MKRSHKAQILVFRGMFPRLYALCVICSAWLVRLTTRRRIRGKRNTIKVRGVYLYNCRISVSGNDNMIIMHPECILRNVRLMVHGDGHLVEIGAGVRVYRSALLWCEDEKGILRIGEKSRFEEVHIAVTESGSKIEIGSGCLFAYGIELRCGDSHSIIDDLTGKRINRARDVKIGDRVWVGMGAKILKGVQLGSDCVVATDAVVTKSFPSNVVVAGNPAREVRQGISWIHERI